jgi:hypothetical protein
MASTVTVTTFISPGMTFVGCATTEAAAITSNAAAPHVSALIMIGCGGSQPAVLAAVERGGVSAMTRIHEINSPSVK